MSNTFEVFWRLRLNNFDDIGKGKRSEFIALDTSYHAGDHLYHIEKKSRTADIIERKILLGWLAKCCLVLGYFLLV